ncbi:hypothetical protein PR048_003965 [Dryococelus australis]|uniref:Uncharacterized protein n=1 Tax=Dryococelus australis TaxID=614101 RepID=A0ABQ9I457_9NEOP|nr:hypothetical protein PR048_003965 [Dryococelus australis]
MQGDLHRGKEGLCSHGLHFGAMTTSLITEAAARRASGRGAGRRAGPVAARSWTGGVASCPASSSTAGCRGELAPPTEPLPHHTSSTTVHTLCIPAAARAHYRAHSANPQSSCQLALLLDCFVCIFLPTPRTNFQLRDILSAALNNEVLRADEGEMRGEWSSAGMRGQGKREIPEKTLRPAVSSGTIPMCENPGATRITSASPARRGGGAVSPAKSPLSIISDRVRRRGSERVCLGGGEGHSTQSRTAHGARCKARAAVHTRLTQQELVTRVEPAETEYTAATHERAARQPRLAPSPPTKANLAQSPAGSPDFRKWESCRTMSLVGGFSRGSPVSPTPSFRCRSIFTTITLLSSQHIAVIRDTQNLFNPLFETFLYDIAKREDKVFMLYLGKQSTDSPKFFTQIAVQKGHVSFAVAGSYDGCGATSARRVIVLNNTYRGIEREVRKGVYKVRAMAALGAILPAARRRRLYPRTTRRGPHPVGLSWTTPPRGFTHLKGKAST